MSVNPPTPAAGPRTALDIIPDMLFNTQRSSDVHVFDSICDISQTFCSMVVLMYAAVFSAAVLFHFDVIFSSFTPLYHSYNMFTNSVNQFIHKTKRTIFLRLTVQ